jgi:1,4-alpha-glucan branching enzyme
MAKTTPKKKVERRRVAFTLEAPEAKRAILMADFNNWNAETHPMKKSKKGVWEKTVTVQPGTYEYKFLVDGEWQNDPKSGERCQNCFGTHNNVMTIGPK